MFNVILGIPLFCREMYATKIGIFTTVYNNY